MVTKTIALEKKLNNFKGHLENAGFKTIEFNMNSNTGWQNADLVVLSGMNENLMGMQDIQTGVPVINATGLSPDDIVQKAMERLGQ